MPAQVNLKFYMIVLEMETIGMGNILKSVRLTFGEESGISLSRIKLGGWKVVIKVKLKSENKV